MSPSETPSTTLAGPVLPGAESKEQDRPSESSHGRCDDCHTRHLLVELCRVEGRVVCDLCAELTDDDIRYLKADHIWGDMGRGGL